MKNKLKKKEELLEISKQFKICGIPIDIEPCESGHINNTYQVKCIDGNKNINYILQYVNTNVFPNLKELMSNIEKVTKYIKEKSKEKNEYHDRITISFIDTKEGNKPAIYNGNWRMEEFIKDTKTLLKTDDLNILYEAR